MSDKFVEIKTQEEFDERIRARIERVKESVRKEYENFLSPEDVEKKYQGFLSEEEVQEKYKNYLSPDEVAEKDRKISEYELSAKKVKVANEYGIPFELASKLSGTSEEDLKKDAEILKRFMGSNNSYPPYVQQDPREPDERKTAMKNVLKGMKGE